MNNDPENWKPLKNEKGETCVGNHYIVITRHDENGNYYCVDSGGGLSNYIASEKSEIPFEETWLGSSYQTDVRTKGLISSILRRGSEKDGQVYIYYIDSTNDENLVWTQEELDKEKVSLTNTHLN